MKLAPCLALLALAPCAPCQLGRGPLTVSLDAAREEDAAGVPGWQWELTPPDPGRLYLWAEAPGVPLGVSLTGEGRTVSAEQRPGGDPPAVWLDLVGGNAIEVRVESLDPERGGTAVVHLVQTRESDDSLAAAADLRELDALLAAADGSAPFAGDQLERLRAVLRGLDRSEWIPSDDAPPGSAFEPRVPGGTTWVESSLAVTRAVRDLLAAHDERIPPTERIALWDAVAAFDSRFLPPWDAGASATLEALALAHWESGSVESARRIWQGLRLDDERAWVAPERLDLAVDDRTLESTHPNRGWVVHPSGPGRIFFWAESSEIPLQVSLFVGEREVHRAQKEGGGPPLVWLDVEAGEQVRLVVVSLDPERGGAVVGHLDRTRESAEGDAVAAELRAVEAELLASVSDGGQPTAATMERLRDALRRCGASPIAESEGLAESSGAARGAGDDRPLFSLRVNDALWDLMTAYGEALPPPERIAAWELIVTYTRRYLPPAFNHAASARNNLALAHRAAGSEATALRIESDLLADYERFGADADDDVLQILLVNHASNLIGLGEYAAAERHARAALEGGQPVRRFYRDAARAQLCRCLEETRRWSELDAQAAALEESLTEGGEHPELTLAVARGYRLAAAVGLGDFAAATDLGEQLLASFADFEAGDAAFVDGSLRRLAALCERHGDLHLSRTIQERLLAAHERSAPADDRNLRAKRGSLANTLHRLGDLLGARLLAEQTLAWYSRNLPHATADVQAARLNLALLLAELGEFDEAEALHRRAIEAFSADAPRHRAALAKAQRNLGQVLLRAGRAAEAVELLGAVAASEALRLGEGDLSLALTRATLAWAEREVGHFDEARALEDEALAVLRERWSATHPEVFPLFARSPWTAHLAGDRAAAAARVDELDATVREGLVELAPLLAPRELEAFASRFRGAVSTVLSVGAGRTAARDLALCEAVRGARLVAARLARGGADDPEVAARRAAVRAASERMAALAFEPDSAEAWHAARQAKESAERELARILATRGDRALPALDLDALSAALGPDAAAVSFWIYERVRPTGALPPLAETTEVLAFVVRGGAVTRIELGPLDAIAAAVERWRSAIVAVDREATPVLGRALAALVWTPLAPALAAVDEVVVVPDGPLHLVPFDALPTHGAGVVGDRHRVRVRTALWEESGPTRAQGQGSRGRLVALGGVDFDAAPTVGRVGSAPTGTVVDALARADVTPPAVVPLPASLVRSGAHGERGPLRGTEVEVAAVSALHRRSVGTDSLLLTGAAASKANFLALAPTARWLHVATHGYFAPDRTASLLETDPVDAAGGGTAFGAFDQYVQGMSPLVLCGLALAGYNRDSDALDRVLGAVSAEELARLELSGCELAVLSACGTNVGLTRAGQGIASLQLALHIAGARTVVTSAWPVGDHATSTLMEAFYDRLWNEGMAPADALRAAKRVLREQREPERDWAGWILSGAGR